MKKKLILLFALSLIVFLYLYIKFFKQPKITNIKIENETKTEEVYSSNIIKNVNYSSVDAKGNEYIIYADQGEIDYDKTNVVYLTKVKALIKLTNSNQININSDYGKYNTDNFDTIFSKNVIIKYLENEIKGEYLDFSIERNSMIISKNVTYTNKKNILKADIVEIDIDTKDTKISMFSNEKKVNIKSRD